MRICCLAWWTLRRASAGIGSLNDYNLRQLYKGSFNIKAAIIKRQLYKGSFNIKAAIIKRQMAVAAGVRVDS